MLDTTRGRLSTTAVRLAWPAVLQALLINGYAFNDFVFVGMLGDREATAALSACFGLTLLVQTLVGIFPVGAMPLMAYRFGAGQLARVGQVFREAFVVSLGWALGVGLMGLLALPVAIRALNVTEGVGHHVAAYMSVLLAALMSFALMRLVTAAFYACGDTRTPLLLEIVSLGINTALNAALVPGFFGMPALGVTGAAIATVISRALPGIVGLALIARGKLAFDLSGEGGWRPELPRVRKMAVIGTFESMAGLLYAGVYMLLNRMAGLLGPEAQGGLGAGLRGIEWIAFAFGDGFLAANVAIVGQNLGAGQPERAWRGAWLGGIMSAASCQLIATSFIIAPHQLCALVTDDPRTLEYAAQYIATIGWVMWAVGLEMALLGALIGAGATRPVFWISGVGNLARVPIAAVGLFGVHAAASGTLWTLTGLGDAPTVTGAFDVLASTIAITAVFKALLYIALLARGLPAGDGEAMD